MKEKTQVVILLAVFMALPIFGTAGESVFSLDTWKGLEANGAAGEIILPIVGGGRVPGGIRTDFLEKNPVFNISGLLNNECGTVMCWMQPLTSITFLDGETKKFELYSSFYNGFMMSGNPSGEIKSEYRLIYPGKESWYHLAVVWEKGKNIKFFVNGCPWQISVINGNGGAPFIVNADIASAKELVIGCGNSNADTKKIDRLRIYNRPLKVAEIYNEYRSIMPIDLVMENSYFVSDKPVALTLNAAPGGYYTMPNPLPEMPFIKANVKLKAELVNDKNESVIVDEKEYKIQEPMNIVLPERVLPIGNYTLKCTVKKGPISYVRMFTVTGVKPEQPNPISSDNRQWVRKKLLYEQVFDSVDKMGLKSSIVNLKNTPIGTYVECAPSAWERMSTEINFPKEMMGKPCLLDITWPDDKTRSMGFYMYPRQGQGHGLRDRLAAGIHAGEEFLNSGEMQTTSYLFFPNADSYLFEARSFGMGTPAAIAAIHLYELDENFPVLKIRKPENLPGRQFVFYDEDQSYDWLLNREGHDIWKEKYPDLNTHMLKETMRYFDYAGTTGIVESIWRYSAGLSALENKDSQPMFPYGKGQLPYVIEAFKSHDKAFWAYINMCVQDATDFGDKVLAAKQRCDTFDTNLLLTDRFGKLTTSGDPSNPAYQDSFISNFTDLIRKYAANPNLGAMYINLPSWGEAGMKCGYGDATIMRFTKETGIQTPKTPEERYAFLTGDKKAEWIAWRKVKCTEFHKRFRSYVDRYNPNLKIYSDLVYDGLHTTENDWREIKNIPNWFLAKWNCPYAGRRANAMGGEPSDMDSALNDFRENSVMENLGFSLPLHTFWETYYETNLNPLVPQKYSGRFQAANVKPVGRNYLKLFAYSVAMNDSQNISIGGQVPSTFGVENMSREFAQAYAALPALPFKTVSGGTDPVTVRSLAMDNVTYFYAVNIAPVSIQAEIDLPDSLEYTDLSSGKKMSGKIIDLLSYQMRSFLIFGKKIEISSFRPMIGDAARTVIQRRFDEMGTAMQKLETAGIPCDRERKVYETSLAEFKKGHLAEAHRLNYSLLPSQMLKKLGNVKLYSEQAEMMKKGHFRINVGSWQMETFDEKLFFPDQRWDGKNYYGFVFDAKRNMLENVMGCMRDISGIHGTNVPDVYRTESFNMDGYWFKLPKGVYKVRFFMKVGYKKSFKPGWFRFFIKAQGKHLADVDLYELQQHDVDRAVVLEKEVNVEDEILKLDFFNYPSKPGERVPNGTERFLNAIEVVPEN